ncbi:MAG: LysR family transcriptional regulator [Pseudomonadota bacterium]
MDIKQLKTFVCVAETGSLSRASDRLRIAQPALSRHIKLLEHEMGIELFSRHVRGMHLTDAGRAFLDRVSGLIRQLEQSVYDIQSMSDDVTGEVALGLMPSINSVFAVRLVERVTRELPHVSLRLVEGYSGHLVEWLQRGDLDVSFLYGPSSDYHLHTKELLYEDIILISPTGSIPHISEKVELREIADLPLIMPSRPHGIRVVLDSAAAEANVSLNTALKGDAFWVLKSLVVNGSYHAFVPRSAVAEEIKSGILEARTFQSPPIRRQLILALPSGRSSTRATNAVISILKYELAKMIKGGLWAAQPGSDLPDV